MPISGGQGINYLVEVIFGLQNKQFLQKLGQTGRKMRAIGQSMTMGLTAPMLAFGGASVNAAMSFNKAMANVGALIPGQRKRLNQLKKVVQDTAIALGFDTRSLAEGMYQVVSAFGDGTDTIGRFTTVVELAKAGSATAVESLNYLSAATKVFGDTSEKAMRQAAILGLRTVRLGQTTFAELASSIGRVTPLAATLGLKLEDVMGVFATLTGVTGNSAEVSTQFAGILRAMIKPTRQMSAAVKTLGFDTSMSMLSTMGFDKAIVALMGTTDGTQEAVAKLFVRAEALNALFALAEGQADNYAFKLGQMTIEFDELAAALAEQTSGVNEAGFTWEKLKAKFEVLRQEMGDALLPQLNKVTDWATRFVDKIRGWIKAFNELHPAMQKTIGWVTAFLLLAGPLLTVLGQLVISISAISTAIIGAGGLLAILTGPVGITVAILAFAGALLYTGKKLDDISRRKAPALVGSMEDVKKAAEEASQALKEVGLDYEVSTKGALNLAETAFKIIEQLESKGEIKRGEIPVPGRGEKGIYMAEALDKREKMALFSKEMLALLDNYDLITEAQFKYLGGLKEEEEEKTKTTKTTKDATDAIISQDLYMRRLEEIYMSLTGKSLPKAIDNFNAALDRMRLHLIKQERTIQQGIKLKQFFIDLGLKIQLNRQNEALQLKELGLTLRAIYEKKGAFQFVIWFLEKLGDTLGEKKDDLEESFTTFQGTVLSGIDGIVNSMKSGKIAESISGIFDMLDGLLSGGVDKARGIGTLAGAGIGAVVGSQFGFGAEGAQVGASFGNFIGGLFGKKNRGEEQSLPLFAHITNWNELWQLGTSMPGSYFSSGRSEQFDVDPHGRTMDYMHSGWERGEHLVR